MLRQEDYKFQASLGYVMRQNSKTEGMSECRQNQAEHASVVLRFDRWVHSALLQHRLDAFNLNIHTLECSKTQNTLSVNMIATDGN